MKQTSPRETNTACFPSDIEPRFKIYIHVSVYVFVGHITRMEMMREEVMLGEVRNGEGSGTQEIGKQGQEMSWGRKK